MGFFPNRLFSSRSRAVWTALTLCASFASIANATPLLVIDAQSGDVILEREATNPWYPASLTKLVTVYTTLKAVRDGRITMDTPLLVSARAANMPPSKMGFKPGQLLTLDNALKMMMVKSANDLAITVAEGVSGSVENFAQEMNGVAASLGMRESHFVNPNGLHDPAHVSSARDLAIVARALYRDFPDHADLYGIGALRLGSQIIPTHNGILGRYPGSEGMKTGYTCPAGFNVVVSATRGGRRLIAVVLGYPTAKSRTIEAASILDTAFASSSMGAPVESLPTTQASAPNMKSQVCGPHRQEVAEDDFAVPVAGLPSPPSDDNSPAAFFRSSAPAPAAPVATSGVAQVEFGEKPYFEPIDVYLGPAPGWTGRIAGPIGPQPTILAKRGRAPVAAAAYAGKIETSTHGPLGVDPNALRLDRKKGKGRVAHIAKTPVTPVTPAVKKAAAKAGTPATEAKNSAKKKIVAGATPGKAKKSSE